MPFEYLLNAILLLLKRWVRFPERDLKTTERKTVFKCHLFPVWNIFQVKPECSVYLGEPEIQPSVIAGAQEIDKIRPARQELRAAAGFDTEIQGYVPRLELHVQNRRKHLAGLFAHVDGDLFFRFGRLEQGTLIILSVTLLFGEEYAVQDVNVYVVDK